MLPFCRDRLEAELLGSYTIFGYGLLETTE